MDAAFDLAVEELESAVSSGQVIPEAVKSCLIREFREGIIRKASERRLMSGKRSAEAVDAAVAKALNAQRTVRDLLKSNDLERGKIEADRILAREGIQLDKSGLEYHSLAGDLLGALVLALDIIADQEQGIPYDPEAPRLIKVPAPSEQVIGNLRREQVQEDNTLSCKVAAGKARFHQNEAPAASDRCGGFCS